MGRLRTIHRCNECGASSPQWSGRCSSCSAWNSLIEQAEPVRLHLPEPGPGAEGAIPILEVDAGQWLPSPVGMGEFDRVLGGGLVPGSVTLLGGEPGIGKSTLLLQAMQAMAAAGARCLLVSAEESKQQVRLRAQRLGALHPRILIMADTSLPAILAAVGEAAPDYLVVDSIQTVHDPDTSSAPGSVVQVRECARQLVAAAKARSMATVLVGHVTKDGALAGPRVLQHVVDTVLSFEGDRHHALRLLRATKHRFGSTGELGLFEMGGAGLVGVADPSRLFLGDRTTGVPGSLVVPTMEGNRPLLVEVQALVSPSELALPRRSAQGLDHGRLSLLVAVLARRARVSLSRHDVYASAVGGVRVTEPAADLAIALALASAAADVAVDGRLVACGEVGLAGEVRQVAHTSRRLAEAARLGFTSAIVACSAPDGPAGLRLRRVSSMAEAIDAAVG